MDSHLLNSTPLQLINVCTEYHPAVAHKLVDAGLLHLIRFTENWKQLCLSDSPYVCMPSYSAFSDLDYILTQTQFVELAQELSVVPREARKFYVKNRLKTLGLV